MPLKCKKYIYVIHYTCTRNTVWVTRVWASSKLWLPNAIERGNMRTRGADKRCERDGLYAGYCERLYCRGFCFNFMFCWPCTSINPRNENQLDALFILSLFRQSTSTCFGHNCSPSSGGYCIYAIIVTCCAVQSTVCWFGRSAGQQTVFIVRIAGFLKLFDPRPGSGQELSLATPGVKEKHELV